MSVEFAKIFVKDSIKLNILREVMAGKVKLGFTLNNSAQNYASDIHSEQTRVKFNISEDPAGEILTIRVFMIDLPLKISVTVPENLTGKNISIFRSSTKSIENTHELTSRTQAIELIPSQECYIVKIHETPIEPATLQRELDEIKSRVESDEEILRYYDDNDTQAITKLFSEIKPKLSQAEELLRKLIEAREAQIARIESATK